MHDGPHGLVSAPDGTTYVADLTGNKIRRINTTGYMQTIAGIPLVTTSALSVGSVDGVGTNARFNQPRGMSLDMASGAAGVLYIVETAAMRVRRLDLATFAVTTFAGAAANALAISPAGALNGPVGSSTFNLPYGCVWDPVSSQLFVLDSTNNLIRAISSASGGASPFPVCDDRWHHAALTLGDGGPTVVKAYIDGNLAGSGAVVSGYAIAANTPVRVGWVGDATVGGGQLFSGVLGEVRAYGFALSAAQVASMATPVFPSYANAQSPTPAVGAASYSYTCNTGYAGPVTTYSRNADLSWAISGPTTCSLCAPGTYVNPGVGCTACPANSNSTSPAAGCVCGANSWTNGLPGTLLVCTICTSGSTSAPGASACTCSANFQSSGVGAGLGCFCVSPYTPYGSGPTQTCEIAPSPSPTPSITPTPTPSPTPSPSSTATPTISTTSTASFTASVTPSSTTSLSPTSTPTPSQTMTPTNTPTPSQTPSVTSVPDVLVAFNMTLACSAAALTPASVAAQPGFLASVSSSVAAVLGLPPTAAAKVVAITDVASGTVWLAPPGSRRLGGAAGSKGVYMTIAINVGKVPQQELLVNLTTVIGTPAFASALGARVISSLARLASQPLASFTSSVSPPTVANSQFVVAPVVVVAATSGSAGSASSAAGGGAAGGVVGAIALACGVWSYRSYKKHNALPCFRNRNKEKLLRMSQATEQAEMARALAEAAGPVTTMDVSRSAPSAQDKANAVRALAASKKKAELDAAAAQAELAELKRQMAAGREQANPLRAAYAPTSSE